MCFPHDLSAGEANGADVLDEERELLAKRESEGEPQCGDDRRPTQEDLEDLDQRRATLRALAHGEDQRCGAAEGEET